MSEQGNGLAKRCQVCGVVRVITQFHQPDDGPRVDECKWCWCKRNGYRPRRTPIAGPEEKEVWAEVMYDSHTNATIRERLFLKR